MKNITLKSLETPRLPRYSMADPSPFPGKYPTHLAWKFSHQGRTQTYMGKPTTQAVAKFFSLLRQQDPWMLQAAWITEFDRVHPYVLAWDKQRGTQIHPRLWPFYHYWQTATQTFEHFQSPWLVKDVCGHKVYSPFRVLRRERQALWYELMSQEFPKLKFQELPARKFEEVEF